MLKATPACKVQGRVLVWLDTKCGGEARTAPHLRSCPLQEEECLKLLGAATAARSKTGQIREGDVCLLPDAGKQGGRLMSSSMSARTRHCISSCFVVSSLG